MATPPSSSAGFFFNFLEGGVSFLGILYPEAAGSSCDAEFFCLEEEGVTPLAPPLALPSDPELGTSVFYWGMGFSLAAKVAGSTLDLAGTCCWGCSC